MSLSRLELIWDPRILGAAWMDLVGNLKYFSSGIWKNRVLLDTDFFCFVVCNFVLVIYFIRMGRIIVYLDD